LGAGGEERNCRILSTKGKGVKGVSGSSMQYSRSKGEGGEVKDKKKKRRKKAPDNLVGLFSPGRRGEREGREKRDRSAFDRKKKKKKGGKDQTLRASKSATNITKQNLSQTKKKRLGRLWGKKQSERSVCGRFPALGQSRTIPTGKGGRGKKGKVLKRETKKKKDCSGGREKGKGRFLRYRRGKGGEPETHFYSPV